MLPQNRDGSVDMRVETYQHLKGHVSTATGIPVTGLVNLRMKFWPAAGREWRKMAILMASQHVPSC